MSMYRKLEMEKFLDDIKFFLYEKGTDGKPHICWYHGGWLMTDNGYLPWSVTVPPMKTTTNLAELRWSKWEESMRKDRAHVLSLWQLFGPPLS